MARRKKNKFQSNANKKKILNSVLKPLNTKSDIKNSLIETGKDLLIGVVAGGFAGAAIGKPSLLIGFVATGAGHFLDNRLLSSLGMGMMASNSLSTKAIAGMEGLEGLEGVKERVQAYKDSLLERTYLDKIKAFSKGKTAKAISGMGDVQYFSYPQNMLEGASDDLALLNQLEHQIASSGMQGTVGELSATDFNDAIF